MKINGTVANMFVLSTCYIPSNSKLNIDLPTEIKFF